MYFLVNTVSVVAIELTLTVTLLGAPVTADRAVFVAPRIVPIDSVVPPGLTLIELGSSTIDRRENVDSGGPVRPAGPASVAELHAAAVASHTTAALASAVSPVTRIHLYALGAATVSDLRSGSTLRRRWNAVNDGPH
jgi:hypothetical protein